MTGRRKLKAFFQKQHKTMVYLPLQFTFAISAKQNSGITTQNPARYASSFPTTMIQPNVYLRVIRRHPPTSPSKTGGMASRRTQASAVQEQTFQCMLSSVLLLTRLQLSMPKITSPLTSQLALKRCSTVLSLLMKTAIQNELLHFCG